MVRIAPFLCMVTLALVSNLGCVEPEVVEAREVIRFEVPRDPFPEFLQVPWPSDILRTETDDGAVLSLRAFPNPSQSLTLDDYLLLAQTVGAYPASGGLYFNLPAGADKTSFPATPAASVAPNASMFLVELAEPSVRIPIEWTVEETGTSFLPAGTFSVFPLLGAVPRGRMALVVTRVATSAAGLALGPSDDLQKLMTCTPIEGAAVDVDCTPYQNLVENLGLPAADIALLQIVTIYDAAADLERMANRAALLPNPEVRHEGVSSEDYELFSVFGGEVDLAQYQAGNPPFNRFDGIEGGFVFDDAREAIVQRSEAVRFVLTVPRTTEPMGGYPVAIYGHGTGGDLESGLGNSPSSEAHQLARAGFAMLAISEPLHFTRRGFTDGAEEILTFNFLNPVAGRDIWRQSVLEKVFLVSAVQNLDLPASLTGPNRDDVSFNSNNVAYFGHSQGGIVGAMLVGVEDRITGAFLSGAGGGFAPSLIEKTEPVNLGAVLRTLLDIPEQEPLDRFHPILTLLQIWVDPADPINYGAAWRERDARRTPDLLVTSGLRDQFTPKRNHGGLAAAYGLPIVAPVSEAIPILDLLNIPAADAEVSGNLIDGQGNPLTGGLLQYPDDGHFAVFNNADAQDALRLFFSTLSAEIPPTGRVLRE